MTLAALLEELKLVDPDTCEDVAEIANVIRIQSDGSISADADDVDFILQGVLQRVIAGRIDPNAEKTHQTWGMNLTIDRDGIEAWIWGPDGVEYSGFGASGESPAEALLAAYIAAVKEEAKR